MNRFLEWMEENFIPKATKIASNKHLVAIKDAFISIMPITMVGSVAVLLNVFLRDLPGNAGYDKMVEFFQPVIDINGNVWFGSLAIMAVVFAFSYGYHIAKSYNANGIAGGLVAFSSFMTFMPQTASIDTEIDGVTKTIQAWGFIDVNYLGSAAIFTAMIVSFFSATIYSKLIEKDITIKMPESVPSAVSSAFTSIIPAVAAVYASAIISYLVVRWTGQPLHDLISTYIAQPLMGLSQGVFSVILMAFLVQLFWFFGIHGHNVLAPAMDGIYGPALQENMNHYLAKGTIEGMPYMWTRGSFDAYCQMGGSGVTIALILAILVFSKKEEEKTVAKLAAPMGVFNINEPIIFGLPIVLNPMYAIPWMIIPPICAGIAYFATAIGFIPPVYVSVPWVLPPGIFAYFATGGSFKAALVSLFNVFVAFLIWSVFVRLANRTTETESAEL